MIRHFEFCEFPSACRSINIPLFSWYRYIVPVVDEAVVLVDPLLVSRSVSELLTVFSLIVV
jgi:hypothetical protein